MSEDFLKYISFMEMQILFHYKGFTLYITINDIFTNVCENIVYYDMFQIIFTCGIPNEQRCILTPKCIPHC